MDRPQAIFLLHVKQNFNGTNTSHLNSRQLMHILNTKFNRNPLSNFGDESQKLTSHAALMQSVQTCTLIHCKSRLRGQMKKSICTRIISKPKAFSIKDTFTVTSICARPSQNRSRITCISLGINNGPEGHNSADFQLMRDTKL